MGAPGRGSEDLQGEVLRSLDRPLGPKRLEDFRRARSAAIAISDETRPVPNRVILPPLLERLESMGIAASAIQILIAPGLHRPTPEGRLSKLLPAEILKRYRVTVHDAKQIDLTFLGNTSRGTPVFVNPLSHRAELRLVVGLIDPHQFVGYTGGAKGAAIGLAGSQTIEANHGMLFDRRAVTGAIRENPVRQDIEEIGRVMGVHWVVSVILDEMNGLTGIFSGHPVQVEQAGTECCRAIYEARVSKQYDLIIASPGGYPKDINVYQAQKGLAHVTPFVRRDGDILFFAECPDGHGEDLFYERMKQHETPAGVVNDFRKAKFEMGGHKAFLWCRSLIRARVHLYSAIDDRLSRTLMVWPVKTVRETLERIRSRYDHPPKIAVVPKANSTYMKAQGS